MNTQSADHRISRVIPILSASNFIIGMSAFVVIGLLNPIAADLNLGTAQAGWIMTSYALAYAVLSPLLVSLTGAVGRRRVLAIGLAIVALSNLGCALAPNAVSLNVARIFTAAGSGMFTPVAAAVAAGLSTPEHQGRSLAAVFFGLTLAQVIGVPAGGFIAYTFGWRSAFAIVAALAIPCIYLIWTRIPGGLSFQPTRLRDLGRILRNGPMMLAITATTTFLSAIYVLYTYIAPLLRDMMGFERNGITAFLLVFGFGAVVGNYMGGKLADRLGPLRTLVGLTVSQAALLPIFSFLPLGIPTLLILVFTWSSFSWSFMASQQVRLLSLAPQSASVVLALNAAAIYVGAAVGSAIGGGVVNAFGLSVLGVAGSLVALLGTAHIYLSYRISGQ